MFSSLSGSPRTAHFWLRALCFWTFLSLVNRVCAETPDPPVIGGLYKELPEGLDEVDVIIAGGSCILERGDVAGLGLLYSALARRHVNPES